MLKKTTLFDDPQENVKLWDPLCGSGTLPLVAASMFYRLPIRNNYLEYFNWHHWPIYKSEYLEEYQQEAKKCEDSKRNQLHIIASDSDFQTVNYALKNLEVLSE